MMVIQIRNHLSQHAHPVQSEPFDKDSGPAAFDQALSGEHSQASMTAEAYPVCDLRHHKSGIGESRKKDSPVCGHVRKLRYRCSHCGVSLETTPGWHHHFCRTQIKQDVETMHAPQQELAAVDNSADNDTSSLSSWCDEGGPSDAAADDGKDEDGDDMTIIDSSIGDLDDAASQRPEQTVGLHDSARQRPDIDAVHYHAFHTLTGSQLATMPTIVRMIDGLTGNALLDTIKRAITLMAVRNKGVLCLRPGTRYLIEADWSRSLMLRFLAGLLTYVLTSTASELEAAGDVQEDEERGTDWIFEQIRRIQPTHEGSLRLALKHGLVDMRAEDIHHILAVRLWALSTDEKTKLGVEAMDVLTKDGDTLLHEDDGDEHGSLTTEHQPVADLSRWEDGSVPDMVPEGPKLRSQRWCPDEGLAQRRTWGYW